MVDVVAAESNVGERPSSGTSNVLSTIAELSEHAVITGLGPLPSYVTVGIASVAIDVVRVIVMVAVPGQTPVTMELTVEIEKPVTLQLAAVSAAVALTDSLKVTRSWVVAEESPAALSPVMAVKVGIAAKALC